MTVQELIDALERVEDKQLQVIVDDPFGSESWKVNDGNNPVVVGKRAVYLQVGDRFDTDDEDHDDPDEAWDKFLDSSALDE